MFGSEEYKGTTSYPLSALSQNINCYVVAGFWVWKNHTIPVLLQITMTEEKKCCARGNIELAENS